PVFATALSKRVAEWIRTTDPISEIVNTPKPGAAMGERLAKDAAVKRVGVLELDTLPAGLYDEIVGAAPALELADATAAFAGRRSRRHSLNASPYAPRSPTREIGSDARTLFPKIPRLRKATSGSPA